MAYYACTTLFSVHVMGRQLGCGLSEIGLVRATWKSLGTITEIPHGRQTAMTLRSRAGMADRVPGARQH